MAVPPVGMLGLLVWQVILGHTFSKQPISNGDVIGWTIFLWLVYFRLITVRLVTEVRKGELRIALRGLWRSRRIALSAIKTVEVISHDPARDYRGYGIRNIPGGKAYVAGAKRAVRVILSAGEKIVVGSERPDELAAALSNRATRS